jgi:hypothetical protein
MTAPRNFDNTPLDGPGMEWLELYAQARATMRTEVVDYSKVAPVSLRPESESNSYVYDPTPYWRGLRR